MFSNRYAKVKHPYAPDYDPTRSHNYFLYLDCNNSYETATIQPLLTSGFRWLERNEIDALDVQTLRNNDDTGYIFEVDLHYPHHLHDLHSGHTLAPDKLCISNDMLSPYSYGMKLLKGLVTSSEKVEKLVTTFNVRTKNFVHYKTF